MKKILLLSFIICLIITVILQTSNKADAQAETVFKVNLGVGSRGSAVIDMQNFLISNGFLNVGNATGYFGNLTRNALRAYQNKNRISPTGYFGPLTRAQMNAGFSTVIGGDRDIHSCVTGGGYSWDVEMNKCVRPWEKLSALFNGNTWYMVDATNNTSSGAYFKIEGSSISGKACNLFSGKVSVNNVASIITVYNTISTRMACRDDKLSKAESDLFGILNGTVNVRLEDATGYIVLSKDGMTFRFSKTQIGGTPTITSDTDIHGCYVVNQHWDSVASSCVPNIQIGGTPTITSDTDIHGCYVVNQHWDSVASSCVPNIQI